MTFALAARSHTLDATMERQAMVDIVVLPGRCWRCGDVTYPIAGVLTATGQFREFSSVARELSQSLSPERLRRIGTGPITLRRSRARPDGYLANGCLHCDAIQGNFPMQEDLTSFLAEGGSLRALVADAVILPDSR